MIILLQWSLVQASMVLLSLSLSLFSPPYPPVPGGPKTKNLDPVSTSLFLP